MQISGVRPQFGSIEVLSLEKIHHNKPTEFPWDEVTMRLKLQGKHLDRYGSLTNQSDVLDISKRTVDMYPGYRREQLKVNGLDVNWHFLGTSEGEAFVRKFVKLLKETKKLVKPEEIRPFLGALYINIHGVDSAKSRKRLQASLNRYF